VDPNTNQVPVGPTPGQQPLPPQQPAPNNWSPMNSAPPEEPKPKKSLKNLPFPVLMGLAIVLLILFVVGSFTFYF
jgi:hypothetical protein